MKTNLIYLLFIVLFLVGCHDQTTEITNSQSQENAKSQYLVPEEQAVNVAMSFFSAQRGVLSNKKTARLKRKVHNMSLTGSSKNVVAFISLILTIMLVSQSSLQINAIG